MQHKSGGKHLEFKQLKTYLQSVSQKPPKNIHALQ